MRATPARLNACREIFTRASIAMFEHIEKCSPRYTAADGYNWHTGDAPCFDRDEHDNLRRSETAAWRQFREMREEMQTIQRERGGFDL